jgi:sugar phosphate isomerase/epimerase
MIIGTMNHPAHDPLREIAWMANLGLEFIDFTIEPPAASSWTLKPAEIRRALDRAHMGVVGHTAFYLPMASPYEEIRCAAVHEFRRCLQLFSEMGAAWMNMHPDRHAPFHDRRFVIERNVKTIEELLPDARRLGVGIMVENLPGDFNTAAQLGELLGPIPELGLHLDMGHANLSNSYNTADEILESHGSRLRHVHLHDNKGGSADLHLPLGAGTIDWDRAISALRRCGYDDTITLEVFTPDKHYLTYSADVLRRLWARAALA